MSKQCKKILLVDDDEAIRDAVADVLDMEGYSVLSAEHGSAALNILNENLSDLPGLILLDMMMPVMDGRGFIRAIENQYKEKFGSIPIVLASANGNLFSEEFSLPLEKLKKPFDMDLLLEIVKKHCGEP